MSRIMKAINKVVMAKDGKRRSYEFVAIPVVFINDGPTDKRWAIDTVGGVIDVMPIANFAEYSAFHKAIESGVEDLRSQKAQALVSPVCEAQRAAVVKNIDGVQDVVSGRICVGGAVATTMVPFHMVGSIILNVANDRLVHTDKRGKCWILVPKNKNDFAEFLGDIEILDGQHRLISFSDFFCQVKDVFTTYHMHAMVFINATSNEKNAIFHNINGECKPVSTDRNYRTRMDMNQGHTQEQEMYDAVKENATTQVIGEDDILATPLLYGNVNMGYKEGRISAKNIVEYACFDHNGELRDDNLPDVMKACGFKDKLATGLSIYNAGWNKAFSVNFNMSARKRSTAIVPNLNIFSATKKVNGGFLSKQSYSNFVWAMAPEIVAQASKMRGGVTTNNVAKVVCVLMNDVLDTKELKGVAPIASGRATLRRFAIKDKSPELATKLSSR